MCPKADVTNPAPNNQPTVKTTQATVPAVGETATPAPPAARNPTSAPNNPSSLTIDPCTLVTQSEAGEVLQKKVGEPDRTPQGAAGDWCTYRAVGASDSAVIGVETGVSPTDFKAKAEAEAGMQVTPVPDLGDEAYAMLSVYTRKGDIMLIVSLDAAGFTTLEDRRNATIKLAQKALARLP